ncbi:alpha/beta hydrolase family protein [Enteractinococcus coprophilus]|nr:alpha/beta fold hydrolase [Enteractinococcus coprophilus]
MGDNNLRNLVGTPFRDTQNHGTKRTIRWSAVGAVTGALAGTALAAIPTLASIFARTVVTPEPHPAEDVRIYRYRPSTDTTTPALIELAITSQTTVRGQYALTFHENQGVARVGEIVAIDRKHQTVTRVVEEIYSGDLSRAVRGRWAGFVWPTPHEAGYVYQDVWIPVDNGLAPAWFIPPTRQTQFHDTWIITVHGRGSKRNEGLRMMGVAQRMGMPGLLVSYRNDGEAPDARDKRYGLGATEWPDIEAAILYALNNGASSVVLAGYSMGAAVSLQLIQRSALARYVRGLVLIGPVIDWLDVLRHQARINRVPHPAGKLGRWLIESPWGRTITGLAAPLDFRQLDWVSRAADLTHPMLILHSQDDDFVPIGPSEELAHKNLRYVSLVRFQQARHTREWNVDPVRFESAVLTWLHVLLSGISHDRPSLPGAISAE